MQYIPDNLDAYRQYERDRERDSHWLDKISDVEETIGSVICTLEDAEPSGEVDRAIKELEGLLKRL